MGISSFCCAPKILLYNILAEVHEDLCYLGAGGPGGRRQGVVPLAGQQTGVYRPVHGLHGIAGDGGGPKPKTVSSAI